MMRWVFAEENGKWCLRCLRFRPIGVIMTAEIHRSVREIAIDTNTPTLSQVSVSNPNFLVRFAFYASIFAIPFTELYLPGTGERVGVVRIVQALILAAALSQPRISLRFVPAALLWFAAYCGLRIAWGFWLSPELSAEWWPSTAQWLEWFLPWLWIMFNVLQFPKISRNGLWALVGGAAFCALLHIAGIGTAEVAGDESRSSVFGQNANVIGATYGVALIVLAAIGMLRDVKLGKRLLAIPLAGLLGIGLAKTASRTGMLIALTGVCVLLFQARSFLPRAQRYAVVALIAAVLVLVVYQMPAVVKRLESVASSKERPDEPRARMFPVLWEIFLRNPIYGSGPDQYQFELTRRAMPYLVAEQRTISAHNLLLLLLVETGLVGLLLFSFGLKSALAAAWRARRKSLGWLPLALIVPLAIAGATVSNPSSTPIFWFAIAYALSGGGAEEGFCNVA